MHKDTKPLHSAEQLKAVGFSMLNHGGYVFNYIFQPCA